MPDKDIIEIQVNKIIPAEKWRVVRLLTKVWEFPTYIACVKEVSVIEKKHNTVKTKWRVQVDGVPISWVEEDTLTAHENTIYFKAIEGDLAEFKGKWTFQEHPEGTEVKVQVQIKIGIPAFQEFADAYITKLLTKNFESILNALEHRLISTRYTSYKLGVIDKIAGFGIIGHLYNYYHLEKCLKMLKPDFKMPSREFISQLYHLSPSFKLCDIKAFKSKTGQTVDGCFVVATFIPDMIEKDMWLVYSKVVNACRIAEKHGVGVVALGGFTSIVAEKIGHQISNEVEVPVTTGNSFTAAMTIEGVVKAAGLLGLDISKLKLTIVGGTGDIGSGCARVLVDKVKQLTITGKTKSNLKAIGAELAKKRKARVTVTTDNKKAVKDADIVIAVASASAAILDVTWFKPGAIVCDVGYPKNISYAPVTRDDILIFSGGLTKPPSQICFPIDVGLPSPDTLYGCFSESIILALEKRYENYSFGRGNITPEKIEEIKQLGLKHGFEVADFYWGDKKIDESMIIKVKEHIHQKK
jgi:predicted amino acid dehydrogenase/ribosome-associated toxin RatA of RatAB toxin-antitoxin module